MYAQRYKGEHGDFYCHFYLHENITQLCDSGILPRKVEVIQSDRFNKNRIQQDHDFYWGFWDLDLEKFTIVSPIKQHIYDATPFNLQETWNEYAGELYPVRLEFN
jgi:hypothetical protein